ncbi:Predicted PurR-regulated permease PerM [Arenibacter palladensis]|uniref:Predicted PurR-regulated permease PerM n=1 Tax=Arenibacter palladensis TaxID=237373 RepID=A0A1M5DPS2_9FLAO|nr:AI-2E family transporter [Arenibacter palladensis]SHF68906.1 Predicted PurR-regulated permease PerM [Arenibacter palladensis]
MTSKTIAEGILRALGVILAIVILLAFLYKISAVLIYIAIAAVASLIGRPIVLFFRQKLKFNNTVAVIITMIFLVGVVAGVIALFVPLLIQQGQNLSLLNIDALQTNLEDLYRQLLQYIGVKSEDLEQSIKNSHLFSNLNFGILPDFLNSIIGILGSFSVGLFSVLFIAFFFLKDSKLFEESLLTLIPDNKEKRFQHSMETIKNLLSRYFVGLVFQILILFVIYSIVLFVFGIENAIVIAFLCALLNLIPYIGPIIGGILMAVLTMTSNVGADFSSVILPKTGYVMIGFIIGQLVDNFFSQPFIFSSSVKSHPLEIFLIIIIGGLLLGVTGMIIAVPGYTAIKVILKEFFSENKIVKSLTKNL